jgi:soluble lytic murein transglycosylase-like protein
MVGEQTIFTGRHVKLPLTLCALLMGAGPALADVPDGTACAVAGRAAELADALPANMLLSIGMVESGRADPLTGHAAPWPWTVNVDGNGQYFASEQDAEAFVRLAQTSGARDIDVGCFQISLEHHPDAFASLPDAFDPTRNAAYAALYLTRLKAQTGSWNAAIADYHSAVPDLGLPYQRQVLAAWKRLGSVPPDLGADIAQAAFQAPDPVVVIQSPEARKVHVYTMNAPDDASWRPGLPHVIDNP